MGMGLRLHCLRRLRWRHLALSGLAEAPRSQRSCGPASNAWNSPVPKKEGISNLFNFCTLESNGFSLGKLQKLFPTLVSPHSAARSPPAILSIAPTLISAVQMWTVGRPGWDVTHKEQRLIADSVGEIYSVPGKKDDWRTRGTSPRTLSRLPLPPSVCFLFVLFFFPWHCSTADIKFPDFSIFKEGSTYTDDNAEGWHEQRVSTGPWRRAKPRLGERCEVGGKEFRQGQCETTAWLLLSSPILSLSLSLLLWSLHSLPLFCASVSSPLSRRSAISIFTLNPAANGSGKLQMFWVNYVKYREKEVWERAREKKKLRKALSSHFIL